MERKKEKTNTKLVVIAVALGLLVVVAGIQSIQLVSLKSKVNAELTGIVVKPSAPSSSSSSDTLQRNIKNLPQMVGGC